MLLVIDVGNSEMVFGVFSGDELRFEFRFKTDPRITVDGLESLVFGLLERRMPDGFKFDACVVSSVVPPMMPSIMEFVRERVGAEPLVVGPGIKTGIAIMGEDPKSLGADRVVNAIAARKYYGLPALVIDVSTAITFDYVDKKGNYAGTAIVPGLLLALNALASNTARLPYVEPKVPGKVLNSNTIDAMQSGAVLGYLDLVDGLIRRVEKEVGAPNHVIATGDLGWLFKENCQKITDYDPQLGLKGLKLLYDLNRVGPG